LKIKERERERREIKKVQLLSHEANLIEAMKEGKDVPSAAESIGITKEAAYFILKRMIQFGIVRRTGKKKSYQYTVLNHQYEVVKKRCLPRQEKKSDLDEPLKELMNTQFTPVQELFYKKHREQDRRILAKQLGMTKAQLNFAIINAGLGEDKVCMRQK